LPMLAATTTVARRHTGTGQDGRTADTRAPYDIPVHVVLLYTRAHGEDPRPVYTVLTYFSLAPTRTRERRSDGRRGIINTRVYVHCTRALTGEEKK
jgi:hypothetical protein